MKIKNWAHSGRFDLTLGKETKEKVGGAQFQRLGDKKVYDWQNTFSMFWHILAKYLNGKLYSKIEYSDGLELAKKKLLNLIWSLLSLDGSIKFLWPESMKLELSVAKRDSGQSAEN